MSRFFIFSVVSVSSVISVVQPLSAQSKWSLTTADFQTRQVDLAAIDDSGAKVTDKTGTAPRAVRWEDLLLLDRVMTEVKPPTTGPAGRLVVMLGGGEQLRGSPVKLEGETLIWKSPAVGEMQLPLRQVSSIQRVGQPAPAEERRTEDLVTLVNGDSVSGIIADMSAENVVVTVNGAPTPVPIASISSVALASAGAAPGKGDRSIRVRLSDESVVAAPTVRTEGSQLVLVLKDSGTRKVPMSAVVGIEQVNGPVSWLSSRQPSESVQTPFLETVRPARMDRTVAGRPIRVGERSNVRGIGVAPHSRITWPLDGTYQTFRTQYTIDGEGSYADVTVRVLLDGKVVHEKANVIAGVVSPVVLVPLGNAKTLTLEVDFGGNYNVQDRLNWIEPALVKGTGVGPTTRAGR